LQIFMPGKPQIWYLDLFAGKNDYEAVKMAGPGGHKEINRTNLTTAQICSGLSKPIVKQQLELLRFRNSCPAFSEESRIKVSSEGSQICFVWEHQSCTAQLKANLQDCSYVIEFCDQDRKRTLITEG
jgi:sucrose phosphorylase